jgi:hypothetical protein
MGEAGETIPALTEGVEDLPLMSASDMTIASFP